MASVGACISTGSVTDTWFFPLHSQQSSHILKMYCWCRTHLHTLFSGEGKYSCQLSDCRLLAQHDCTSPEHRHYITVGFLIRVQFLPIGLKKNCITMTCEVKILCIKIKFTQMCVICNNDNDIWHYLARCEGKSSNGVIQLVFWWKWTFDSFFFLCYWYCCCIVGEWKKGPQKKSSFDLNRASKYGSHCHQPFLRFQFQARVALPALALTGQ